MVWSCDVLLLHSRCYKGRQLVGVHDSEICPGAENCCQLQVKVWSHDASVQRILAPPLIHFNKTHNKFKNGLPVVVWPPAVSGRLTGESSPYISECARSANRNADWVLKCRLHYFDVIVQYDITSFYRSESGAVQLDEGLMWPHLKAKRRKNINIDHVYLINAKLTNKNKEFKTKTSESELHFGRFGDEM